MFVPPASVEDIPSIAEMIAIMDRTVAGLETFKEQLAVVMRDFMVAAASRAGVQPGELLGEPQPVPSNGAMTTAVDVGTRDRGTPAPH